MDEIVRIYPKVVIAKILELIKLDTSIKVTYVAQWEIVGIFFNNVGPHM